MTSPFRPAGLLVPLVTPFDERDRVDVDALEALAASVLAQGAAGVVALATTGEPTSLDQDERDAVVAACARVCADRGAVLLVGAGTNDTRTTIARHERLADVPGVAGSLAVVPYYVRPSEAAVVAHFAAVAARSPVPLVVYNIPYRTGRGLGAPALLELADVEGVAGLKQAVGALDADTLEVLAGAGDRLAVLGGDDPFVLPVVLMGGTGAIAASAHLCTARFAAMLAHGARGEVGPGPPPRRAAAGARQGAVRRALPRRPEGRAARGGPPPQPARPDAPGRRVAGGDRARPAGARDRPHRLTYDRRRARSPVLHRLRRGQRAHRHRSDGAARRVRARPAGHGPEGVRRAAGAARAPRRARRRRRSPRPTSSRCSASKPAIHRFPGAMAQRVHDLAVHVRDHYDGDAARVWTDAAGRRGAARQPRGAAGLRRDEGQGARRRAGQALRRRGGARSSCRGTRRSATSTPPRRSPTTRRPSASTRPSGRRPARRPSRPEAVAPVASRR